MEHQRELGIDTAQPNSTACFEQSIRKSDCYDDCQQTTSILYWWNDSRDNNDSL